MYSLNNLFIEKMNHPSRPRGATNSNTCLVYLQLTHVTQQMTLHNVSYPASKLPDFQWGETYFKWKVFLPEA